MHEVAENKLHAFLTSTLDEVGMKHSLWESNKGNRPQLKWHTAIILPEALLDTAHQ
jgi:hypothetical protein